jgi:ABC-type multidrug transport system ATPase subunit/ABC-type multidrug transport system permease subunit
VHEFQAGRTYVIGRDPQSDIVLTDSRVSWRHAQLRIEGDTWVLEDLGSTNGTFLGPERSERIEITIDCVVRLGNPDDGPILRCTPHAPAGPEAALPAESPAPAEPARPRHAAPAASDLPPAPAAPPAPYAAASSAPPAGQRHDSESWWQQAADPEPAPPDGYAPQPQAPQPQAPQPRAPQPQAYPPAAPQSYPPAAPQAYPGAPPQPYPPAQPYPSNQPYPSAQPFPAAEPVPSAQPFPAPDPFRSAEYPIRSAEPAGYLGRPPAATPDWADTSPKREPSPGQHAAVQPDLLPSVDRRPTARMPLPAKAMRIGRLPGNDLVLPDLDVSKNHAELRKSPTGSYEIVDLGSHNGTFVNGQRVTAARSLTDNDLVSIGHSTFRLKGGELVQFVDDGQVTFTAQDLVVTVAGGKVLLDHVTFPIPEKCLLGVIGPSGAGKSTLLGALTGMRPADTGTVLYDNRDLYADYAELRYRIGLVPQESVLHTQLTARRALQYSGELRFPADTTATERDVRVDEVMGELGLTKHANTRADRLSGGQLKRVNVAQELLTKPSLLFLDEPTSGLDPGLDKSVMEQMRDLAHDGRTVIVVTHSVANLGTCDRLLVLVPGGRIAFYGPPEDGLRHFGMPGWAEVFQAFEAYPDRDWAAEFASSPAYAQYVLGQRVKPPPQAGGQELPAAPPPQRRGGFKQMTTLTRRYVRVISADRGYLLFMGLLPVVLGALIHFVGSSAGLTGFHNNQNAEELLLMLTICACLSGAASSIRELVKERTIYVRERAAGLSSGAYLFSKLIVLGVISIVQSALLVLIGLFGQKMPAHGALPGVPPLLEILVGIAVLSLASMCLGLFVSAMVSTSEKAMPFLVLLTMVQVILSGGVVSLVGKTGLEQLAYVSPSRWGFGAVSSTVNLNVIGPVLPGSTDPLWDQSSGNWLKDMGVLVGLGVLFTLLAWLRMRRLGPRRRKGQPTKNQPVEG